MPLSNMYSTEHSLSCTSRFSKLVKLVSRQAQPKTEMRGVYSTFSQPRSLPGSAVCKKSPQGCSSVTWRVRRWGGLHLQDCHPDPCTQCTLPACSTELMQSQLHRAASQHTPLSTFAPEAPGQLHGNSTELQGLAKTASGEGEVVSVVFAGGSFSADLAQDHALADQALEGLLVSHHADVVQHLVPEPCVQQVQHCMFRAACAAMTCSLQRA